MPDEIEKLMGRVSPPQTEETRRVYVPVICFPLMYFWYSSIEPALTWWLYLWDRKRVRSFIALADLCLSRAKGRNKSVPVLLGRPTSKTGVTGVSRED